MTGIKLLLDTNIVIDILKGDNAIISFLEKQQTLYIPVTVLGELYLGAFRSINLQKHLASINDFLVLSTVLNTDIQTAAFYASIKTALLKKGKPIPENDIWIAAAAIQHQLPLFTNDKHFSQVDDLSLVEKF
jgi:tRNA(fMet)-specific endonuclease VapC